MKKVFEILGQRLLENRDVGIEIECEGKNLFPLDDVNWTTVHDGSLRGLFPEQSCEWVLKKPLHIAKVKKAIDDLATAQAKSTLNFSFRTSVHVHVNVQTLTELQVLNLIYTYLLLEEPLMSFSGKERKCNRFCLRLQDAEGLLDIVNSFTKLGLKQFTGLIREDHIRYSAINLAALKKYGSIEFRSMRGTLDKDILWHWVNTLIAIRSFAVEQKNPLDIYEVFVNLGPVEFVKKVLGQWHEPFLIPKLEKEINRSFSLSLDIPHIFAANRRVLEEEPIEKPAKPALKAQKIIKADGDQAFAAPAVEDQVPLPRPIGDIV